MLNEVDKELERRGHKFVRYADDMVIFCKSRRSAKRTFKMLKSLGIHKQKAWEHANTRKGYWRTSGSPILSTSLTNQVIKGFGFLFFSEYYRQVTA